MTNNLEKPARSHIEAAADNFVAEAGPVTAVEEYGRGIIHDTYLVKYGPAGECFILQRVNTRVFQEPHLIMQNMRVLSDHLRDRLESSEEDWKMARIIRTRRNADFFIDPDGGFWRALSFIGNAHPLEAITGPDDAREAGRALGIFHRLTNDLDPGLLHDTLPGFHDIESYLTHYDRIISAEPRTVFSETERYCRASIESRRAWAPVLENGRRNNRLQVRVIHGDPKSNNVLLDNSTGRAVSIIDLDTVKPGLLLYDVGDCLRSCCNMPGNEPEDLDTVRFDPERGRAVLSGYMAEAAECLTDGDLACLFDAARLIPFELGLRFYTDYCEGDVYFKSSYRAHNLHRAMEQFRLVESIEQQETGIRSLVEELHPA